MTDAFVWADASHHLFDWPSGRQSYCSPARFRIVPGQFCWSWGYVTKKCPTRAPVSVRPIRLVVETIPQFDDKIKSYESAVHAPIAAAWRTQTPRWGEGDRFSRRKG